MEVRGHLREYRSRTTVVEAKHLLSLKAEESKETALSPRNNGGRRRERGWEGEREIEAKRGSRQTALIGSLIQNILYVYGYNSSGLLVAQTLISGSEVPCATHTCDTHLLVLHRLPTHITI